MAKLIQWPDKMQASIATLVSQYVKEELPQKRVDSEVQEEYTRHKEYLESTLRALRDR